MPTLQHRDTFGLLSLCRQEPALNQAALPFRRDLYACTLSLCREAEGGGNFRLGRRGHTALGLCLHQNMWTGAGCGSHGGCQPHHWPASPLCSAQRRVSWDSEVFVHYLGKIKLRQNPKSHPQQYNERFTTTSSSIFEIILFSCYKSNSLSKTGKRYKKPKGKKWNM